MTFVLRSVRCVPFRFLWSCSAVLLALSAVTHAASTEGPNGTLYFASYAGRLVGIEEATGKTTTNVPLKTGLAWNIRPSGDSKKFYVQSADLEHFEVVDVASGQSVDTFTLSGGEAHVRALAFEADPQGQFMVLVTRTATKHVDRFDIGAPSLVRYDLRSHTIVQTLPWAADPEPRYYGLRLRFSPDGRLLYMFTDKVHIYDATRLEEVDSWDLSVPDESGAGRLNLGSADETYDEPGMLTALFTSEDPVQHRRQLLIGRVDLNRKRVETFPLGPSPDAEVSLALAGDRARAYILLQEIGRYEVWTIDLATKRRQEKVEFESHPRVALRASSDGRTLYLFEAGNTIDLYQAQGMKYLRTMTLGADMMYNTFYVIAPRPH